MHKISYFIKYLLYCFLSFYVLLFNRNYDIRTEIFRRVRCPITQNPQTEQLGSPQQSTQPGQPVTVGHNPSAAQAQVASNLSGTAKHWLDLQRGILLKKFNATDISQLPADYQDLYRGIESLVNEWYRLKILAVQHGWDYNRLIQEAADPVAKTLLLFEQVMFEETLRTKEIGYTLRVPQIMAAYGFYKGYSGQIACNEGKTYSLPAGWYLSYILDGWKGMLSTTQTELVKGLVRDIMPILQRLPNRDGNGLVRVGMAESHSLADINNEYDVMIGLDADFVHSMNWRYWSYLVSPDIAQPYQALKDFYKNWRLFGDEGDLTAFYRLSSYYMVSQSSASRLADAPSTAIRKFAWQAAKVYSRIVSSGGDLSLDNISGVFDSIIKEPELDNILQILGLPLDDAMVRLFMKRVAVQAVGDYLRWQAGGDDPFFVHMQKHLFSAEHFLVLIDRVTGEALKTHQFHAGMQQFLQALLGIPIYKPTHAQTVLTFPLVANNILGGGVVLASGTLDFADLADFLFRTYGMKVFSPPRFVNPRITVADPVYRDGDLVTFLQHAAREIAAVKKCSGVYAAYADFKDSPMLIRCQTIAQARLLAQALKDTGVISATQLNDLLTAIFQYSAGEEGVYIGLQRAQEEGKVTLSTFIDRGVNILPAGGRLIVVAVGVYDGALSLQLQSRGGRGTDQEGLFVQILPSSAGDIATAQARRFQEIETGAQQGSLRITPLLDTFYRTVDEIKSSIMEGSFLSSVGLELADPGFASDVWGLLIIQLPQEVKRFNNNVLPFLDVLSPAEQVVRVAAELEKIINNLRNYLLLPPVKMVRPRT